MNKGKILFLNGVTSTGKTSIVHEILSRKDRVYCPLEICRQRNLLRGDRKEYQSHEQMKISEQNIKYSYQIDTSIHNTKECADLIIQKFLQE